MKPCVLLPLALAGLYCQVMLAGLYPIFIYEVLKKYLQAQAIVIPQMFVAIISNVWCVAANFLFVDTFGWGYVGAPIARMTTNFMLAGLTGLYILIKRKNFRSSWGTWPFSLPLLLCVRFIFMPFLTRV